MLTVQQIGLFFAFIYLFKETIIALELNTTVYQYTNISRRNQISNVTTRKCCPSDELVVINTNGSFGCAPMEMEKDLEFNKSANQMTGFPNCSFRILKNRNYKWFRNSSKVEVGLVYLLYPVWLETKGDYCIDSYKENLTKSEDEQKNLLIGFCDLQGLEDYYAKAGLAVFFLTASAAFNGATMTIYLALRHIQKSREWLQFAVFTAEFLGHVFYDAIVILHTYYLTWTDSLVVTQYLMYLGYYMYTVKFTLGIAASIDILICVWKPFLAADEYRRTNRNIMAIIVCCVIPMMIPGLTNLQEISKGNYLNSNVRIIDGIPSSYKKVTSLTFFAELGINIVLGITTAVLIYRQRKKMTTSIQKKAHLKNRRSFLLYVKLICASEIPFFLGFVLLVWFTAGNPLSLWWNLTRGAYLVSAIYVFIFFGCSKKHRHHLLQMYSTTMSSTSANT